MFRNGMIQYDNGNCMALEFTDQNFDQEVLQADKPVVVDFWAPWCGPCRIMGPILEALHADIKDSAKVGKVNVDENPQSASRYNVMSIPTIKIFKNGREVKSFVGVQQKDALKAELASLA
jgi:thioredoxin 1